MYLAQWISHDHKEKHRTEEERGDWHFVVHLSVSAGWRERGQVSPKRKYIEYSVLTSLDLQWHPRFTPGKLTSDVFHGDSPALPGKLGEAVSSRHTGGSVETQLPVLYRDCAELDSFWITWRISSCYYIESTCLSIVKDTRCPASAL